MALSSYLPPKPSPLAPGYQLDRYELLCPIAEGGMGAVWLARQRGKHGFQKLVAVKTILPTFASEPDFRALFLDEARLASRIDHTNVAQVLDLGEENDVLYLVIEWVDGDSLHKLARTVSRKSLPLPQAILLRVLSDACSGLHAAHELRDDQGKHLGVVHRDVSPQNILVNVHGTSKVIDFGIAKARDRLTQETRTGVVKGKVEYMSPEQALGLAVDVRADIWAIGAVFYRIVTGKSPYDASSPVSTMELLRTGQLPEPLSAMPGVHPAVCKVVARALAPRAAERFATAAELHDAFQIAMTEAGACASAKDVQAFVATHLGERISARKRTIQIALDAAAHRDKLAAVLKSATLESTGTIVIPGGAANGAEPPHTPITRREVVPSVDAYATTLAANDAAASGFAVPPHVGIATIEPARARLPAVRIWGALVLVLGMGSILGTLSLLRAGNDVPSRSAVTKVVDAVGTGAPLSIETAILPAKVQEVAGQLTVPNDAGSALPPAPSSTESTRQVVGPLPRTLRPRLSPRSGDASPKRVTGDDDGI
ncbi:MAG TPA: serine/threonine-protein kinase [Polyangiaceae bacterium]|nr:serine/threonine-protein kinase [Polyangiaceae bacterium]